MIWYNFIGLGMMIVSVIVGFVREYRDMKNKSRYAHEIWQIEEELKDIRLYFRNIKGLEPSTNQKTIQIIYAYALQDHLEKELNKKNSIPYYLFTHPTPYIFIVGWILFMLG